MNVARFDRSPREAVSREPRVARLGWVNGGHAASVGVIVSRYRLGELLLALLIGWGIFGQRSLVLVATWLNLETRGLTLPARALTFGLAIMVFLSLALRPRFANLGRHALLYSIFWMVYSARLLVDGNSTLPDSPETERIPLSYIATMAAGACWLPGFAVLMSTCWGMHRISRLLIMMLSVASGAAMLLMFREQLTAFEHRMAAGQEMGDITALHPLALGYTGAVLIVFALHALITHPRTLARRIIGMTVCGTIGIALVVASASRGPLVALVTVLLVLVASQTRRGNMNRMIAMVAGTFVIGAGIVLLTQATGSTLFERLLGTTEDIAAGDGSATRIMLYQQALDAFARGPWFGSASTLDGLAYPHNLIIESLMATGLVGTASLLALILAGVCSAWRLLVRRPEVSWLPLLYVLFLTGSMFSWSIYSNVSLWLTLAGTLSCAAWMRNTEELR